MTREEYERQLHSEYWRGYSYSLIKERNFTCADCGRRFPNERNKLQVHHLVYRDAKPWSYDPDELIVLCEECHQKRHGIVPEPEPEPVSEYNTPISDNYERSYSFQYNVSEKDVRPKSSRSSDYYTKKKRSRRPVWIIVCILAAILVWDNSHKKASEDNITGKANVTNNQGKTRNTSPVLKKQGASTTNSSNLKSTAQNVAADKESVRATANDGSVDEAISSTMPSPSESTEQQSEISILDEIIDVEEVNQEQQADVKTESSTKETLNRSFREDVVEQAQQAGVSTEGTTSEILDRINHANVVKQAQRAGVSTEGSTGEVLDRINHANVVKQAQRAGVSTEGTTGEIIDRINHANVVKQAQRAGVSTEGSTGEIIDRINHANVVKQAERAGVSTEGSTGEILDRINHANVVKQAQRAGVSTEGTTGEILERITQKHLEKYGY